MGKQRFHYGTNKLFGRITFADRSENLIKETMSTTKKTEALIESNMSCLNPSIKLEFDRKVIISDLIVFLWNLWPWKAQVVSDPYLKKTRKLIILKPFSDFHLKLKEKTTVFQYGLQNTFLKVGDI